ncbi:MAG: transglycosylase SLT domain-containing protein [gamma proteobacterium symbiont of Bathyaustriella thionipta]|nr:transglycosylase SLT domain-containing protein [gamma proteobacterium symbiont of Bathyaustriella thionipta]MCU7949752.1 transglycosylase SLT domain-containing protein [gamma proteobacterium symbiont of Bathyaustriella thionipta]MCU7952479.1 transglycosylase SLT domain-containing protein [gamma proteobacterium symbiont of Bathyaustriella thionipta]MCU7956346.1 transglycosylase SLT domain-containing protein [gamma proteobacterium symbiont of Bathyaustriella thionipta]MCU7965811.1 transglycosy
MFWRSILWLILFAFPMAALADQHKHVKHKHWTKKYDRFFKKNTKHYFGPGFDWHLFKAQGIAESGLNPKARSKVGAKGIMQIMPATYQEIIGKQPRFGKIDEPRWNIAAAIYYNRQLYKRWIKKEVAVEDRMNFTFASYNAGFNRVLKARKKLREKNKKQPEVIKEWDKVSPFTPSETRYYIRRIDKLMQVKHVHKKS